MPFWTPSAGARPPCSNCSIPSGSPAL
jgi:hypothetical protein